jgi:hypothetical protein
LYLQHSKSLYRFLVYSYASSVDAAGTIWDGNMLSFSKSDNANLSLEENQDPITDKVWITRGNEGKQIFNMAKRTSADKSTSPVGTEWSIGTIDQVSQLFFKNLSDTSGNKPKSLVGKNMVLHLVEDNIYISIKFTSWSSCRKGGFAYERSTPK